VSHGLRIDDWLDDERDALTDEIAEALAPRRPDAAGFAAGVRERIERGEQAAEGDPATLDLRDQLAQGGRLRWVAGFFPPMLLSKGAAKSSLAAGGSIASKAGIKFAPTLASAPFVVLVMIVATFVFAGRALFMGNRAGEQASNQQEAAAALRGWWRRNLPIALASVALLALAAIYSTVEVELLLILLSALAATSQVAKLTRAGLASRTQVGHTMGGFLMLMLGGAVLLPARHDIAPLNQGGLVPEYLLAPILGLAVVLCFALATDESRATGRRVRRALAIWTVAVAMYTGLMTDLSKVEVRTAGVRAWVAAADSPELRRAGNWQEIGAALRLMQDAGEPVGELAAFERVVHEVLADPFTDPNLLDLLPLLRLDQRFGTDFAGDAINGDAFAAKRREDLLFDDRLQVGEFVAISLLGFGSPAAFDDYAVDQVRELRRRHESSARVTPFGGDANYDRVWREIVESPWLDPSEISAAARRSLVERILDGVPNPEVYEALESYVLAAEMLEFLGAHERAAELAPLAHAALRATWTPDNSARQAAFPAWPELQERTEAGEPNETNLTFVWLDSTATAVEAMARWGLPKVAEEATPVDLRLLAAYLEDMAHVYPTAGIDDHAAVAAAALARMQVLPEYAEQLQEPIDLFDLLYSQRLLLATALLAATSVLATWRAPVPH
jgi:hypothetical protein